MIIFWLGNNDLQCFDCTGFLLRNKRSRRNRRYTQKYFRYFSVTKKNSKEKRRIGEKISRRKRRDTQKNNSCQFRNIIGCR